jgi:iron(III) transport system ATP-binding protein
MTALSVRSVRKRYGQVTAVDEVSFDVRAGELITLLGPSGCGKTTTLRLVAGLERGDAGEIDIDERPVASSDSGLFVPPERRGIGMVFQSYAIWPHMTVFGNVAYPLRIRRLSKPQIQDKVERVLDLVGLHGLEDRLATELSGGQQQRVALARALVFEPRLLLLDEPLSNLDAKLRAHMRIELKRLQATTGITTVYVTHDQIESMSLSDRTIVMNQGRIEQVGDPQSLYERPATRFVADFIGSTNLLSAVISGGIAPSGHAVAVTSSGRQVLCTAAGDVNAKAGDPVLLLIRPERIRLDPEASAGGDASLDTGGNLNRWIGRVSLGVYYGDRREYVIELGDDELHVLASVDVALGRGQEVGVTIHRHHVLMLRDWEGRAEPPLASARH